MPWKIQLKGNVTLEQGIAGTLARELITDEIESKLKSAVRAAPIMTGAAIAMIEQFAVVPPSKKSTPADVEVQHTLIKYFSLYPTNPRYGQIVSRIVAVYKAMRDGLLGGYPIFVFAEHRTPDSFRHAFVNVNKNANKALGEFFADDSERHWQWDKFKEAARNHAPGFSRELAEEIHLNYEWFKESSVPVDMVALTIVHEASHKWAYTTDVCYKSSTINKIMSGENFIDAVRQGFQPAIERENDKPLYPMAKPGPKKVPSFPNKFNATQSDTWVKNADSYAWAARRLWKKIESLSTHAEYT